MNATQDASNDAQNKINRQLIDYNEKQNDLIFSLRKRLFDLEKIQKRDCIFLIGMNFLICTACILLAVEFGGLTW
jgi:hypothetical protein|tara:strand:+ start:117 stop:341 length:225 start_codon:yes stop_codon:yes gene_type:complete